MSEKTIVMRKDGHWYVVSSERGDEREILLALIEHSQNRKYNIEKEDVLKLVNELGYSVEVHNNYGMAS